MEINRLENDGDSAIGQRWRTVSPIQLIRSLIKWVRSTSTWRLHAGVKMWPCPGGSGPSTA